MEIEFGAPADYREAPGPPSNERPHTLGSQKASTGMSRKQPPNTERCNEKLIKVRFSLRIYSDSTQMRGGPRIIPGASERTQRKPSLIFAREMAKK